MSLELNRNTLIHKNIVSAFKTGMFHGKTEPKEKKI